MKVKNSGSDKKPSQDYLADGDEAAGASLLLCPIGGDSSRGEGGGAAIADRGLGKVVPANGSECAGASAIKAEYRASVSVVNLVFYILCLTSVGSSLYLNFRQTYLEERLRQMHHLDDRLARLEDRLQGVQHQHHSHRRKSSSVGASSSSSLEHLFSTTERDELFDVVSEEEVDEEDRRNDEDDSQEQPQSHRSRSRNSRFQDVVRKLSLQVEGIQRLRRDVSHLKLTRQQRQTAIEQTPDFCGCPAGNEMRAKECEACVCKIGPITGISRE